MADMSIIAANAQFEARLRARCDVVEDDLRYKRKRMDKSAFVFLRATYFRWAQTIEGLCPDLKSAIAVLSIGDTHVENFGTWRDLEGRLIWGANDFDEASVMPYPFDLVRLASSAMLAAPAVPKDRMSAAVLRGYAAGLKSPKPCVVDNASAQLVTAVADTQVSHKSFWAEMTAAQTDTPPDEVRAALLAALPGPATDVRFARRRAGGGGLGRPRFIVVAPWLGGLVVREAKALVPSAWDWAQGHADTPPRFLDLAKAPWRAADPYLGQSGNFIIRRLAPDAHKHNFSGRDQPKLGRALLEAMGCEIGGLHAATPEVGAAILRDLKRRPDDWLLVAAQTATEATRQDFKAWRSRR